MSPSWIMCGMITTSSLLLIEILMPPSHLSLPNNQSLSYKPGKALSVVVEASGYPNARPRTWSGDF